MNNAAALLINKPATVWPQTGTDSYGQDTFGAPYIVLCNYRTGGKLALDDMGEKFVPSATFRTFDSRPSKGDRIAYGDLTSIASPNGIASYKIRTMVTKTPFLDWRQRYDYMTG